MAVGSLKREDEEDRSKPNPDYVDVEFEDHELTYITVNGQLYKLNPKPMRFMEVDGMLVQVYPTEDGNRDLTLKQSLM